jgi:hypothetical protein
MRPTNETAHAANWRLAIGPPPLSIQSAARIADSFMSKIPVQKYNGQDMRWKKHTITLEDISGSDYSPDRWIYRINYYEAPPAGVAFEGIVQSFEVIVFMDGTMPEVRQENTHLKPAPNNERGNN